MRVTVVVPVGPSPANSRWLSECLDSIAEQTWAKVGHGGIDLVLVDDMSNGGLEAHIPTGLPFKVWRSPWYLGVAHAFNIGVAVSPNELVFMLGSDDWLEPECIEYCVEEYAQRRGDPYGYYFVGVRYSDTGETQDLPCHAAMVSKTLWRVTGGLPVEAASGASDSAFISIMLRHSPRAGRLWKVADGKPVYNYRRHSETDTASKGPWQGVILETRHLVTLNWTPRTDESTV